MWGALLGLLGSLGGAAIQANQPGPVSQAEQKNMGQSNMPDPVPMQGQEDDLDWDKLFAMLAKQSTPPLYNIMPQLYQGMGQGIGQPGPGGQ